MKIFNWFKKLFQEREHSMEELGESIRSVAKKSGQDVNASTLRDILNLDEQNRIKKAAREQRRKNLFRGENLKWLILLIVTILGIVINAAITTSNKK